MEDPRKLSVDDAVRLRVLRRVRAEAHVRFDDCRTAEEIAHLVLQRIALRPDMTLRNCETDEAWGKILETFDEVALELERDPDDLDQDGPSPSSASI